MDEQINHVFAAIQQRLNRKLDSPYPSSPSRSKNSPSSKKSPSGNEADEVIDEHSDSLDNRMEVSGKREEGSNNRHDVLIRPYMIAGGYKPCASEESKAERSESIQFDMEIREQLARTVNPLGPYFPEPNLFIDGHIVDQVAFGDNSAESMQLKESVSRFILNDMLAHKPANISAEEWEGDVQTNIVNNRHPDRNTTVATFFNLAIETSTDRLFKRIEKNEGEEINNNLVAQHHQSPNNAKPAYLLNRYDKERNGEDVFTQVRNFLAAKENKNNM